MNDIDPTKPLEVEPQDEYHGTSEMDQMREEAQERNQKNNEKLDTETPDKEEDDKLNPNQELFCQYYATDREFFGNGTQTYLEVYEIDRSKPNWYKTAQAAASRLLSNVIVCKRINELIEANGLNDNYVDKQLEFLVTQHSDFKSKLGAIKEYNQLKQRIINRLDHTTLGEKIPDTRTIVIDTRPQEETAK